MDVTSQIYLCTAKAEDIEWLGGQLDCNTLASGWQIYIIAIIRQNFQFLNARAQERSPRKIIVPQYHFPQYDSRNFQHQGSKAQTFLNHSNDLLPSPKSPHANLFTCGCSTSIHPLSGFTPLTPHSSSNKRICFVVIGWSHIQLFIDAQQLYGPF